MRCFIIGSGPSLEGFDFHKLDREVTFGINYICRHYEPTVYVFGDWRVYAGEHVHNMEPHRIQIDRLKSVKITRRGVPDIPGFYYVPLSDRFHGPYGLSRGLYRQDLTGIWTLSLAIALGYRPIYLLGYDCCFKDGKGHYYSSEMVHDGDNKEATYQRGASLFKPFQVCSDIYNCSDISLIKEFPKVNIDDVLAPISPAGRDGLAEPDTRHDTPEAARGYIRRALEETPGIIHCGE